MTEFYWMTRTGAVLNVASIFLGIALAIVFCAFIFWQCTYDKEEKKAIKKFVRKYAWIDYTVIIVCSLLIMFVPSKKDMLMIYGVGGAIDYVKDNDKARQLPDKVVDAIDAYLESLKEGKPYDKRR